MALIINNKSNNLIKEEILKLIISNNKYLICNIRVLLTIKMKEIIRDRPKIRKYKRIISKDSI